MKTTISTKDPKEAQRILSSLDMALAIWEIQFNLMKRLEHFADRDVTVEQLLEKTRDELNDILNGIDVDSIIE
jgi:hypothetical protein